MGQPRKNACSLWASALLALAGPVAAQQSDDPPQVAPAPPVVQTLEEVRALPPEEEEVLDLYKFDNPIRVDSNRFGKSWSPPPSPKEITEGGGYLAYGFSKLIGATAKGLQKIPGVKGQVHPAVARPPPLDLEQMDRAARIREAQAQEGTGAVPNE